MTAAVVSVVSVTSKVCLFTLPTAIFAATCHSDLRYVLSGYSIRERDSYPQELPSRPPYTAHLGNLSYDATSETVSEFFEGCDISSVRIIEDRIEQRPKGFAYAEFKDLEGLKKALTLDGESFQGRSIRVKIADPRKFTPTAKFKSLLKPRSQGP